MPLALVVPLKKYLPLIPSFGWSHGREIMNGMPDMLKGSYYANPIVDCPQVSAACKAGHHEIQHRGLGPLWALEQVNHRSLVPSYSAECPRGSRA